MQLTAREILIVFSYQTEQQWDTAYSAERRSTGQHSMEVLWVSVKKIPTFRSRSLLKCNWLFFIKDLTSQKFYKNSSTTFWEILLTDRKSNANEHTATCFVKVIRLELINTTTQEISRNNKTQISTYFLEWSSTAIYSEHSCFMRSPSCNVRGTRNWLKTCSTAMLCHKHITHTCNI